MIRKVCSRSQCWSFLIEEITFDFFSPGFEQFINVWSGYCYEWFIMFYQCWSCTRSCQWYYESSEDNHWSMMMMMMMGFFSWNLDDIDQTIHSETCSSSSLQSLFEQSRSIETSISTITWEIGRSWSRLVTRLDCLNSILPYLYRCTSRGCQFHLWISTT